MRKTLVVAVPFVASVILGIACSSSKPQPIAPTLTVDASVGTGTTDAAPTAAPADAAPAPVATGPAFFTDAGSTPPPATSATPAVTDQVMDTGIDLAISTAAAKVAPKMSPEGQPGRATLKEGEHFGMVVNLMPNRCYTFVGFAAPGTITQLDIKLFALPLNVEAGKSSPPDKALPGVVVMGKGTAAICPVLPVAVPYKVDVVATKGAGRMGVHVYARNK